MKYIIILADGMADEPIEQLGGLTPLEAAHTPHLDWLTSQSRVGSLHTVPEGYAPGSEVAHLALLGYNLDKVFEGRGSLEAASMGIEIEQGEMAMRCNLICIENEKIKNHSAGHISDEEANILIDYLNENLADENVRFFPGVSYRHLLKIKGGNKYVHCTPPHDVPGTPFADVLVKAEKEEANDTAKLLNHLIIRSQELLAKHPINLKRIAEGRDPANSIWPWSAGYKPAMQTLGEKFGVKKGVVISAVDLIRGIGVYCGLKPIIVEGATGLWNTNYEGKVNAAINALNDGCDFVFLHIEASDEAGHEGDYELKKRTIEALDTRVCAPLLDAIKQMKEPVSIAVLPDHPTPCAIRTHSSSPVPLLIYRNDVQGDGITSFSERTVGNGALGTMKDDEFIKEFLRESI